MLHILHYMCPALSQFHHRLDLVDDSLLNCFFSASVRVHQYLVYITKSIVSGEGSCSFTGLICCCTYAPGLNGLCNIILINYLLDRPRPVAYIQSSPRHIYALVDPVHPAYFVFEVSASSHWQDAIMKR